MAGLPGKGVNSTLARQAYRARTSAALMVADERWLDSKETDGCAASVLPVQFTSRRYYLVRRAPCAPLAAFLCRKGAAFFLPIVCKSPPHPTIRAGAPGAGDSD